MSGPQYCDACGERHCITSDDRMDNVDCKHKLFFAPVDITEAQRRALLDMMQYHNWHLREAILHG